MVSRWMVLLGVAALTAFGCDSGGGEETDAGVDAAPECEDESQCDDEIDCTTDLCVDGECRNRPDDSVCDDGDRCNGVETCSVHRGCEAGEPLVCDDMINCTEDFCDRDRQRCISEPNDDLCPEGYFCDVEAGGCAPEADSGE